MGGQSQHIKRLEITQKRAIRAICLAPYNAHTQPLFSLTETLSLQHMIELNYLKLGSNIIQKREPKTVRDVFPLKSKWGKTRSAKIPLFQIPLCKRKSDTRLPQFIVAKTWNTAVKYYGLDMLAKVHIMSKNYKEMRITEYKYFSCEIKKCYACKKRGKKCLVRH